MKILYIALLIFIPNVLFGQTWKLQKDKPKGKFRYEYWMTISEKPEELADADTTIFASKIFDPIVYKIFSKEKLTDDQKKQIEACIKKNLSGPFDQCYKKKKYKIYMLI